MLLVTGLPLSDIEIEYVFFQPNSGQGDRVKIQLYYECLCPDCRTFDSGHFKDTVLALALYLDINVYPYGNARVSVVCQLAPSVGGITNYSLVWVNVHGSPTKTKVKIMSHEKSYGTRMYRTYNLKENCCQFAKLPLSSHYQFSAKSNGYVWK